jgi:cytoskeletal protein RodZ
MICSVGQRLRQARLEQRLDLSAVVAKTKINEKYLKAIEGDQRESLPSAFFYKHFVDQYARALSLDVREILDEVDRLLSAEAPLPLPGQNEKVPRRISPVQYVSRESHSRLYLSLAVLALALVGSSGLYIWWHDMRLPIGQPAPNTVQAAAKSAPTVKRAQPLGDANPTAPTTDQPASLAAAQSASPQHASVTETARLAAGYKVLLDLIARESTWLSISSDGRMVFTGVLTRNQTKTVEGKEFARLRVGNAAALDVRLNGKPIGPLGSQGQGLVVVFTPGNFQIVAPVKEGD